MAITVNKPLVYSSNTSDTYPDSSTFDGSSVAYIKSKEVKFYGKNIQHDKSSVGVGDVVYKDSSNNLYFYDGETVTTTVPQTGLTLIGVVINRRGNQILVHYCKGMDNSGWTDNLLSIGAKFFDSCTNVEDSSEIGQFFSKCEQCTRVRGTTTGSPGRAGVNYEYLYNKVNGSDTGAWCTTDDAEQKGFAKKSNFDAGTQNGAGLQAKYGTYDNYLRQQLLAYPRLSQILGLCYGKAEEWSYKLQAYKLIEGGTATNASSYSTTGTGASISTMLDRIVALNSSVGVGHWYLIGLDELFELFTNNFKMERVCKAFKNLNKLDSVGTLGNYRLFASHRWCCARYSSTNAWFFHTDYGALTTINFNNASISVSAVTLLEL